MVERICKCCGKKFQARSADVKRGWANFCSKSCKAKVQEARTGQYRNMIGHNHISTFLREAPNEDFVMGFDNTEHQDK